MNDERRKQILSALHKEKQGIVQQLKRTNYSGKNGMPSDQINKEQHHQDAPYVENHDEENEQQYSITFNKFRNNELLSQMRLTPEEIQESNAYIHRDMQEQPEDEEEDDNDEGGDLMHANRMLGRQKYDKYLKQRNNNGGGQESHQLQVDQKKNFKEIEQYEYRERNGGNSYEDTDPKENRFYSNASSQQEKENKKKYGDREFFISDQLPNRTKQIHQPAEQEKESRREGNLKGNSKNQRNGVKDAGQDEDYSDEKHLRNMKSKNAKEQQMLPFEHKDHHASCKVKKEESIQIGKKPLSYEERNSAWERLYDDRRELFQEREKSRRQREEDEIAKYCSHTPALSPLSQLKTQCREGAVEERLHKQGKKFKDRILKEQKIKEISEQAECTFKPAILNVEVAEKQAPLYERFAEVAKRKQEVLFQLQEAAKETFQPQINEKSSRIMGKFEDRGTGEGFQQRLSNEFKYQQIKKEKLQTMVESERDKECVFRPKTNSTSSIILQTISLYDGSLDVVDRQAVLQKQREERIRRLQEYELEYQECTFQPQLNMISEMLVGDSRATETQQMKIDRLYKQEMDKRKENHQSKSISLDGQNTFKPNINPASAQLKPKDLDELAYNHTAKYKLKTLQLEKEADELRGCSFMPSTTNNSLYSHVESKYSQDKCAVNVRAETQDKVRRLREQKKEKDQAELKECTFHPSIKREIQYDKNESVSSKVKGMESFLENKDKAEKAKAEKLLKQSQLFDLHKKYDPDSHNTSTIIVPFKLSSAKTLKTLA